MLTSLIVRENTATALLVVCAALIPSLGCGAESTAGRRPDKSLLTTAQQTYELLLNDYRSGKATGPLQLELLNIWSKRIFLAQTQAPWTLGLDRAEVLKEGHDDHMRRMVELEKLVRTLADAGKVTAVEVAAARFFRLETESLLTRLDESRQLLGERELDVVLPEAGEAQPLIVQPRELFINVSRDGRYFVSGKEVDAQEPHFPSTDIPGRRRCGEAAARGQWRRFSVCRIIGTLHVEMHRRHIRPRRTR
jgi:hypothetical protein